MDLATFDAADFTITPALANQSLEYNAAGSKLVVNGDYQLGTAYTFTLKNGAAIDDCPGLESKLYGGPMAPGCVKSATYTSAMDQVTMFTTAAAIVLKSSSPKDNTTESVAAAEAGILLTFNQEIDDTTFDAADYTITPALPTGVTLVATNLGAVGAGSYEQLEIDPTDATGPVDFPPGAYTFTLKSSAVLKDKLGNSFSPSADLVIHFTVKANAAPPPPHTCL
jgi:hypothetical protein